MDTPLGELFETTNARLGPHTEEPEVFSVTKYDGFVPADQYFGKRVASAKLDTYKVVEPDEWAYSTIHIDEGSIARNRLGRTGVVSPMYTTMRLTGHRIHPYYAEVLLRSPWMLAAYSDVQQGSINRRRSLPWKVFAGLTIPLPPLAEQRRIVDLIGSLDETIAAAEVVSNALRTSASALASHMWMAGSPERLRDLGQLVTGATPSTKDASSWSSKDVPFVTPAEVPWGGQVFDSRASERFVSESAGASSTRRLDGTGVLQVCIGATVGKVGVTTGPALFNQQINAVFGLSVTDARVLAASMASPQFQTEIKRAAGSSTMPLISKGSWGEMEVRLPDEDSRTQWASMLEGADAAATAHAKSIADLRALLSNLLTALLSGEHEIPATYDELMVGEE